MTVRELIEELENCDPDMEVMTWDNYKLYPLDGGASEVYAPEYGLDHDVVILFKN